MTSVLINSPVDAVDSALAHAACFALFDDQGAEDGAQVSRLYTDFRGMLSCHDADGLEQLLDQMQQALRDGLQVVTLFQYALGAAMLGMTSSGVSSALAEVLLFGHLQKLSGAEVGDWLQRRSESAARLAGEDESDSMAGLANLRADTDATEFDAAIARIHAYIEAGDTYQVNYTYRLHVEVYGSPLSLYCQLRQRQPVPYGALISLPDGRTVLSLSPELFVHHQQGVLTARPMKGTAAASTDLVLNKQNALALAADPKNCAENVMIVDLLRNDLGRIAQCGSVQVPRLFEVSQFNTILQMTSTVQATLRADVTLHDVMTALYPCGSITGAPKYRTMQIIAELEVAPRRLYTGAIGWFDVPADQHRIGDFCLSVPIRTLLLEAVNADGIRTGEMGVGAGIVHDSVATEEYAECALKARFLTSLHGNFCLFETIYASAEQGCRNLDLHLARLRASAIYFGFRYDQCEIHSQLTASLAHCGGAHRLRLSLAVDGTVSIVAAPMAALEQPIKVMISAVPTKSSDLFLRHKTTRRRRYDDAWKTAEQQGAFDMLFFNQKDELTEGGRSNVFVKLAGRWYTPPLSCGLLPGVMRSLILADPAWEASERRLTRADVHAAEQLMICNSLRGVMTAEVMW